MDGKKQTCIWARRIDSFQKLRVLLFFYKNPDTIVSPPDLARRLYLGDVTLVEGIIGELQQDGFLEELEAGYKLCQTPEIEKYLQCLHQNFERPVRRQRLLNEVSLTSRVHNKPDKTAKFESACEQCSLYISET